MIYFIECPSDKSIKIGYTESFEARLATLQTAHARRLKVLYVMPGNRQLEDQFHQRFDHLRISSDGWEGEHFRATPELRRFIQRLRGEETSSHPWRIAWQSMLCLIVPRVLAQLVWGIVQLPFDLMLVCLVSFSVGSVLFLYWLSATLDRTMASFIKLACISCGLILAIWKPV